MKKGLNAKIIIIACAVIIIGTVAAILIINKMSDKEESANPTGEVQTTDLQHVEELSYEEAVIAYQEAIRLNPEDMTNYTKLAKLHLENNHEEEAVEVAYEGIGVGKKIKKETGEVLIGFPELAQFLVDVFKDFNRMDDLKKLLDELEGILDDVIFAEEADIYFPDVTASLEAGTYEEAQTLSLESAGKAIYYTLDGSEPTKESEVYAEPISLDGGEYIVKAMAQGTAEQETFGDVMIATYTIDADDSQLTEEEMVRLQELYEIVSKMDLNIEYLKKLEIKENDEQIGVKLCGYAYDGEKIVEAKNVKGLVMCPTYSLDGEVNLSIYYGDIGNHKADGYGNYYDLTKDIVYSYSCNWVDGNSEGEYKIIQLDFNEGASYWVWSGIVKEGKYDGKVIMEMYGDNDEYCKYELYYQNGYLTQKGLKKDSALGDLWVLEAVEGFFGYFYFSEADFEKYNYIPSVDWIG